MLNWLRLFKGRRRPPEVRTWLTLEGLNGRDLPSVTLPDSTDWHDTVLVADMGSVDLATVAPPLGSDTSLADLTVSAPDTLPLANGTVDTEPNAPTAGIGDDKKEPKKEEPKKEEPKKEEPKKDDKKGDLKKVSDSELKGIDVHKFKEDFVGKADVSKFDVYKNKAGKLVLVKKSDTSVTTETDYTLDEAKGDYPKK